MHGHISTLLEFRSVLQDLEMVQSWIDKARDAAPTNQSVQAELDRQQSNIHYQRARIELAMNHIRNSN